MKSKAAQAIQQIMNSMTPSRSYPASPAMATSPDDVRSGLLSVLGALHGSVVAIENLRKLSVGFSWITWSFDLLHAGRREELILRLGPPDGLLAPYSAQPEAMIFAALQNSGVPVPRVTATADTDTPFHVPFLICQRMQGEALIPWAINADHARSDDGLQRIARQFIRILAEIHRIGGDSNAAAGLLDGVTTDNAALRQIEYWAARYRSQQLQPYPIMERALDWLRRHAPRAPQVTVLHGDYRIGNFLVADNDISAILDWEMVHAGDPHQDLAWALFPPFALQKILARDEVCALYHDAGGCAVSLVGLAYYNVLNHFKMTVINMGALCNFAGGSNDLRLASLGFLVPSHLAQLQRALREAGA